MTVNEKMSLINRKLTFASNRVCIDDRYAMFANYRGDTAFACGDTASEPDDEHLAAARAAEASPKPSTWPANCPRVNNRFGRSSTR